MALPTTRTPPITDPARFRVLLYGASKIGKSTFCSHFPGALFLATEAGLGCLDVFQSSIRNWDELLAACSEIAEGKHSYKTIVVDTVDNAFRFCSEWVCKRNKVDHESDLGYGKGFSFIRNEFFRFLTKLSQLPYGLILVSHSVDREFETRTGKRTKTVPTLPDKAAEIALGLVDLILYADIETKKAADGTIATRRVIRTKPALEYEAGDRTGKLPEVLPLEYAEFLKAYAAGKNGTTKEAK